jgi:hypothetical protein
MTFAILTPIAVTAVALLFVGLRGRRVGDEPWCRRCDYDLTGAPAGSMQCPECGADLSDRPRAVVIGRRVRRAWPIAVGATLLLGVSLVGGVVGVARARGIDWKDKWPDAWLVSDARRAAVPDQVDAIDRLIVRDGLRTLSTSHRGELAWATVSLQNHASRRYDPKWGDWLVARAAERALPADAVQAFFEKVFAGSHAMFRPTWRAPVSPTFKTVLRHADALAMDPAGVTARLNTKDRVLVIDGRTAGPPRGYATNTVRLTGRGESSATMAEPSDEWGTLAPGLHSVEWRCPIRVFIGDEYVRDEAARPQLARVDVAFDVLVRQGDGPGRPVTTLTRRRAEQPGEVSHGLGGDVKLEPGEAELIFRASPEAARRTVDLFEIWDGELRIADVPVEQEQPWGATQPATTRSAGEE